MRKMYNIELTRDYAVQAQDDKDGVFPKRTGIDFTTPSVKIWRLRPPV